MRENDASGKNIPLRFLSVSGCIDTVTLFVALLYWPSAELSLVKIGHHHYFDTVLYNVEMIVVYVLRNKVIIIILFSISQFFRT